MIAKHSAEESKQGEGVEVIENCPIDDPEHGKGLVPAGVGVRAGDG